MSHKLDKDVNLIVVGSTNPVKTNSVINAASETWPEVVVRGFSANSGVNEQPRSDLETKTGAINRAKHTFELAKEDSIEPDLSLGMEGGVFEEDGQMWSTVWVAVMDRDNNLYLANGARFLVPKIVADTIRDGGEMGPIMADLVSEADVRKKQGMIGIITKGFIDRTEEYTGIVKMALGLWYGRNWDENLVSKNN